MAQITRKLPSEAKPRMVNCDSGHSFFYGLGSYTILLHQWRENTSLLDAQWPGNMCFLAAEQKTLYLPRSATEKTHFLPTEKEKLHSIHGRKKKCPRLQFAILGLTSNGMNVRFGLFIFFFAPLVKMYYYSLPNLM